jgi:transmembrane sensor
MKYQHYRFRDFMLDEDFQRWVLEPEAASQGFWPNYILLHPDKEDDICKARKVVLELHQAGTRKELRTRKAAPAQTGVLLPGDQQALWLQISQGIAAGEPGPLALPAAPTGSGISLWNRNWTRMAAAVLLLMAIGGGFWLRRQQEPEMMAYQTAFGQTRQVTLPDSSVLVLNANSRLTFARSWPAGEDREVTLAGEAYFQVRPAGKARKFKVLLSGGAQVEVLGTAFTVTNRPQLTRVVLNHGKVQVGFADPQQENGWQASAIMAPGELVEVDRRDKRLTKTRVARPEHYSAFVHNKIEFNDSPLSEVARVLQDTYGYKVRFEPASLASKRFTSSNPDNRVDLLLFAIEKSFNLQVSRKGKHILIKSLDARQR